MSSSIYLKTWFNKGIRYVNDLIDENGNFYTQADFRIKTGINTNQAWGN